MHIPSILILPELRLGRDTVAPIVKCFTLGRCHTYSIGFNGGIW